MSQLEKDLAEIRRLLAEAYRHYFAGSDGYAKSSEGAISLHYPEYFWEASPEQQGTPQIEIYSYVFAEGRREIFATAAEALETVRRWHAEEMATRYCPTCGVELSDRCPYC